MKKKAARSLGGQDSKCTDELSEAMRQLVLPLVNGVEATRDGLMGFVHAMGVAALGRLLEQEAVRATGPKGKRQTNREAYRWGATTTPLPFGGRDILVSRPRVRSKKGGEVRLPLIERLRQSDPLPERVAEQIVLGVSTRGYPRSLEPVAPGTETRRTSKSSASRALIAETSRRMAYFLERRLDELDIIALFVDGIEVGGHAVVVALGISTDGKKAPLGLWVGSTENATVCTALVQSLIERGLNVSRKLLCVIDGGKGLRKALIDVLGNNVMLQRCQVHKRRNVRDHLPKSRQKYVARQMAEAYASQSSKVAKKRLLQLASWLERVGEEDAAASVREGLDETLTVVGLGLPPRLVKILSTTNPIENMNGAIRRTSRNVKRWRGTTMIRRWVVLAVTDAEKNFRRIKGFSHLPLLVRSLRGEPISVAPRQIVA